MSENLTAFYSNMIIYEGLDSVPKIVLTLKDNKQIGFYGKYQDVTIEGYNGFIDRVANKSLYIKCIDSNIFQKVESKYLGNSLRTSISALNIKSEVVGEFPDINQEFYMVRELPWQTLIRLSRYLPQDYYLVCLGDKIRIFKTPTAGQFTELAISTFVAESNYGRDCENIIIKMKSDSTNGNPGYSSSLSIPLSSMMTSDIVHESGIDVVNNYLSNYINRDAYFPENLMFSSRNVTYEIGQGVSIGGVNLMIISRSVTINNVGEVSGAYRCIKVS